MQSLLLNFRCPGIELFVKIYIYVLKSLLCDQRGQSHGFCSFPDVLEGGCESLCLQICSLVSFSK